MSSNLPDGFLDRLRTKLKLSHVASRWIAWDARRSNPQKGDYWASCPFHDEKTSSFHVDDRKGFFYCFGCKAKGDAISLVAKLDNVEYMEAVRRLAFMAGIDGDLHAHEQTERPTLLQLKSIIVAKFSAENFLEIGLMTGWESYIQNHDRLLRSLSWGDSDYPGHVLDMLIRMNKADDGSIKKIQDYVTTTFTKEAEATIEVARFSATKQTLGYEYEPPRHDVVAVMMPFESAFAPVYKAIQEACSRTQYPARRVDEIWNESFLIKDILSLINHSAVVVCDLTGRNANVFYELGIAHAWARP